MEKMFVMKESTLRKMGQQNVIGQNSITQNNIQNMGATFNTQNLNQSQPMNKHSFPVRES